MKTTAKLRRLLKDKGIIVAPGAPDALTARIIEMFGFTAAYMGGNMTGIRLCTTEPLTSFTEMAMYASYITNVTEIPLIVDGNAGWGDAIHTFRAVEIYENAGIAAMHIEDQLFPKRAHYFRDVVRTIPAKEMVNKIKSAIEARRDEDFVIIARTDVLKEENYSDRGVKEAIRRGNQYLDAGADVIMPIGARNLKKEKAKLITDSINAPCLYTSHDPLKMNAANSVKEIEELGFKIVIYSYAAIALTTLPIIEAYKCLKATGTHGVEPDRYLREGEIGEILGKAQRLPKYYTIEEKTTEKTI
jgi:methylisocitrate lyase